MTKGIVVALNTIRRKTYLGYHGSCVNSLSQAIVFPDVGRAARGLIGQNLSRETSVTLFRATVVPKLEVCGINRAEKFVLTKGNMYLNDQDYLDTNIDNAELFTLAEASRRLSKNGMYEYTIIPVRIKHEIQLSEEVT